MKIFRRKSNLVKVGNVSIGNNSPIVVQSMVIKTTDKILMFTDKDKNRVVIRSAAGLNYRIEVQ